MNHRRIAVALLTLIVSATTFQNLTAEDNSSITRAKKLYIIPIETKGKNPNQNTFDRVIFQSLHTFFSLIPSMDVPEISKLDTYFWMTPILFRWDRMNIESAPPQILQADYIIYGDYDYTASDKSRVKINLAVWEKKENKNVFARSYNSSTDVEVFDTIDTMIENIVRDVLKIDFSISKLQFTMRPGEGRYDVYINNRKIDSFSNGEYMKGYNVLSKQTYHIRVVGPGGRVVFDQTKTLKEKEIFDISYTAQGLVTIQSIAFTKQKGTYRHYLNGEQITNLPLTTNMTAYRSHSLKVDGPDGSTVYKGPILLADRGSITLAPTEQWPGGAWHGMVYTLGASIIGAEAHYFINRQLYLMAGAGFTFTDNDLLNQSIYCLSPKIGGAWYFYNDINSTIRAGAGLSGRFDLYLPFDSLNYLADSEPKNPYSASMSVFVFGEWTLARLELGAGIDVLTGNVFLSPLVGFRF